MSVRSMTGFARVRRAVEEGEIVVSLKSVNHRGLDLHFHLPPELDAIEHEIRGIIKKGVARGHMQINVSVRAPDRRRGVAQPRAVRPLPAGLPRGCRAVPDRRRARYQRRAAHPRDAQRRRPRRNSSEDRRQSDSRSRRAKPSPS